MNIDLEVNMNPRKVMSRAVIMCVLIIAVFIPGQLFAQRFARQINAAPFHRAGHVGEVNPLKETVSRTPARGDAHRAACLQALALYQ